MSVGIGDVIKKRNHTFEDNGKSDYKPERPCLVFLANVNDTPYYLTMATHNHKVQEWYQAYPDENYLLTKKKCEGLEQTSLVNLVTINKGEPTGRLMVIVPSYEMEKLKRKFKTYQSEHPHKLYSEIEEYL